MRAAIKARLADELSAIAGRCYDVHEPSARHLSSTDPTTAIR
ncbi:MAG: hypothetical protein K0R28_1004 [Paenibacillus sp.]|nr:hypothetical protein [Paenibacillus sp.]